MAITNQIVMQEKQSTLFFPCLPIAYALSLVNVELQLSLGH